MLQCHSPKGAQSSRTFGGVRVAQSEGTVSNDSRGGLPACLARIARKYSVAATRRLVLAGQTPGHKRCADESMFPLVRSGKRLVWQGRRSNAWVTPGRGPIKTYPTRGNASKTPWRWGESNPRRAICPPPAQSMFCLLSACFCSYSTPPFATAHGRKSASFLCQCVSFVSDKRAYH